MAILAMKIVMGWKPMPPQIGIIGHSLVDFTVATSRPTWDKAVSFPQQGAGLLPTMTRLGERPAV